MFAELFAAPPLLADLAPEQAAIVRAGRAWVAAQRHGRCCPLAIAAVHLDSPAGARALHLLLAGIGACWPEPVAIAPPCCPRLTHDEATLIGMVLAAHRHGRPVFDALLCEMLDGDARDRLFAAARSMGQTIAC
jgi:hypothetical protein